MMIIDKEHDKIVARHPGTRAGHEMVNYKGLQNAIADPNHGYYLHKDEKTGEWCVVRSDRPPKS